jgi:hypothetical protein
MSWCSSHFPFRRVHTIIASPWAETWSPFSIWWYAVWDRHHGSGSRGLVPGKPALPGTVQGLSFNPASRMSAAQRSWSARTNAANASDGPASEIDSAKIGCAMVSGALRAAANSALSFAMRSGGVPAGAKMPPQGARMSSAASPSSFAVGTAAATEDVHPRS